MKKNIFIGIMLIICQTVFISPDSYSDDLYLEGVIESGVYYTQDDIHVSNNASSEPGSVIYLLTAGDVFMNPEVMFISGSDVSILLGESGNIPYDQLPPDLDLDEDAMPDWWEVKNGLDTLNDDAALDKDADGIVNYIEYILDVRPYTVISYEYNASGEIINAVSVAGGLQ